MEEKFVLLNLKMTDIWEYSTVLTAALQALVDKTEITGEQYDEIKNLRDFLWEASVNAI